MPQVTLYLDEDTDAKARAAATAAGLSYSRWVCELIRSRTVDEWPTLIRDMAGRLKDFPMRADDDTVPDVRRVSLD